MKRNHIPCFFLVVLIELFIYPAIAVSQRWDVIPLPTSTTNVKEPVQSLNGTWKFSLTPPEKFWDASVNDADWNDITVPGEPTMQGFKVEHDKGIAYRTQFTVPKKFSGKRIFVRFESVYSDAKVWINGHYVRDHSSGFTSWDCEITDYVKPGQKALLAVGVVDRFDEVSFVSGYAGHPVGGILRDVYVYCLPNNYIYNFDIETQLDNEYEDAVLKVTAELSEPESATLKLTLKDPSGKKISIKTNEIQFDGKTKTATIRIPVKKPLKWDAEHPNLYTLTAALKKGWSTKEKVEQKVGFCEVEVKGNKILVNGKQIHLRGVNRHDMHPTLGRTCTEEIDLKDVLLAKEANINFIRTSHYPPSKAFLEYCDQYGIYVEEETAVCFINQADEPYGSALWDTQHKPEYTDRFLSRLYEMIDRDRNHASVIIWSTGNENRYGINFQKSYDLAKELDPTRPVMFSYPGSAGKNHCYDIESQHYPYWYGDSRPVTKPENADREILMKKFTRLERTVIADEWDHKACYNEDFDVKRDPGIRNYWGQSLRAMWENTFVSNGTAGGAIWGMIDETFQLPDKCGGWGEWGICDTWRRKKPEFWLTKKAYSPIRIDESAILSAPGKDGIEIPINNWFDHTNFSELSIQYQVGDQSGTIHSSLAPGEEGTLIIPVKTVKQNAVVHLCFYSQFNSSRLIDEFKLAFEDKKVSVPKLQGPAPELKQDEKEIVIKGQDFEVIFDKQTGSIKKGIYQGRTIIVGGPSLNLTPLNLNPFALKQMNAELADKVAKVHIVGSYDQINVAYNISIDGCGVIEAKYSIANPPEDSKSYDEVGLDFDLVDDMDLLQWERNGYYSVYPETHIGRNSGIAKRISAGKVGAYRTRPQWPWQEDMYDFFYVGKDHDGYGMTQDFRSTKENIYDAMILDSKSACGLIVRSDGQSQAVRISQAPGQEQRLRLHINLDWAYNLAWGNKNRQSEIAPGFTDTIFMQFAKKK